MRKLVTLTVLVSALGGAVGTSTAQAKQAHVSTKYIVQSLLCIHSHEGSWTDPGWPYWGGLQMDISFQKSYGPSFYRRWGTADHWPVWAQLQAGIRGARARGGFNPWPKTALMCGLPLYWI